MSWQAASVDGRVWPDAPWSPRRWQAEALEAAMAEIQAGRRSVISAVMGAGKSILIAELAARQVEAGAGLVLVTTPTRALVEQLAGTISERLPGQVGRYYTDAHEPDRAVVVACNASAESVAEAVGALDRRADLWIADEVHKTETSQILAAYELIQPRAAIGLTATPYRSEERQSLSLWESVAYRYSLGDALGDSVLVPWRVVPWTGGGDADLDEVCWRLIQGALGPGMVNATTIDDAEEFAAWLTGRGMAVAVVHSRRSSEANRLDLERLRAGDLRAVVHVNMLAEGVDLPWLRWLCLRRPVGARVRFQQEVGRVLRSAPGKAEAILYDPHDLFGTFGWHYTEAIGEWARAAATCGDCAHYDRAHGICRTRDRTVGADEPGCDRYAGQATGSDEAGDGESATTPAREGVSVDPISAWCRRLLLPLQAAGLSPSDRISSLAWRRDQPSSKQLDYLRRLDSADPWRALPGDHGGLVRRAIARSDLLSRGAASDLISAGKALAKGGRYPEITVDPPPDGALDGEAAAPRDPKWYAAGAYRKTGPMAALVVMREGRVVGSSVAPRGSRSWVDIQVAAVQMAADLARRAGEETPVIVIDSKAALRARPSGATVEISTKKENPASSMVWRVLARGR